MPTAGGPATVRTFAAGASGNVAPTSTLTLPDAFEKRLAIDSAGNLYVTDSNTILVYAPGSAGAAAPTRSITSSPSQAFEGIAVDTVGNIFTSGTDLSNGNNAVNEFPANANGPTVPTRLITGSGGIFSQQNAHWSAVAVDANDTAYVASYGFTASTYSTIYEFSSTANGAAAPSAMLGGAGSVPFGVAVSGSTVYTIDSSAFAPAIYIYGAGPAMPTQSIKGSATGFNSPADIAIGPAV